MEETKTNETKTVKSSTAKTSTTKTAASKPAAPKAAAKTTTKASTVKAEEVKIVEVKAEEVKPVAKTAAKKPANENVKKIKVTLVKSYFGRLEKQQKTLIALGLKKIGSSNIVPDNSATRGMIFVVKHLVKVENV